MFSTGLLGSDSDSDTDTDTERGWEPGLNCWVDYFDFQGYYNLHNLADLYNWQLLVFGDEK